MAQREDRDMLEGRYEKCKEKAEKEREEAVGTRVQCIVESVVREGLRRLTNRDAAHRAITEDGREVIVVDSDIEEL